MTCHKADEVDWLAVTSGLSAGIGGASIAGIVVEIVLGIELS
jgi:hypothetical protein